MRCSRAVPIVLWWHPASTTKARFRWYLFLGGYVIMSKLRKGTPIPLSPGMVLEMSLKEIGFRDQFQQQVTRRNWQNCFDGCLPSTDESEKRFARAKTFVLIRGAKEGSLGWVRGDMWFVCSPFAIVDYLSLSRDVSSATFTAWKCISACSRSSSQRYLFYRALCLTPISCRCLWVFFTFIG